MLKKSSTVSVDVWIWIFYFSDFAQNTWNSFETNSSQIANVIVLNVSIGKFFQMHKSWISISQNSMSITWNDSTFSEGFVDKLFDNSFVWSLSLVELFKFHQPFQTFLVGQTVKWSS